MEAKNSDRPIQTARFTLSLLKIWIHHYSEKKLKRVVTRSHYEKGMRKPPTCFSAEVLDFSQIQ